MDKQETIFTSIPSKGMITDYSDINGSKEVWVYARNVAVNSQLGEIIHIQNEPSTLHCVDLPYLYLGSTKLKNNKHLVFTGNNIDSEIGIFDELNCTYTTLKNDSCLNFKTTNPIFVTAKENYDCTESVYWADGQLNELRYLNLDKIPLKYTIQDDDCKTKVFTDELDCNELSFTKKFSIPIATIQKGSFGTLKNGTYQVAIGYSNHGQKITDYFSVTNPIAIWQHKGSGGSLEVEVSNLDRDFDNYQMVLIYTIEGITGYQIVGEYSTAETKHTIFTNDSTSYINIPAEEISVKKTYYQKADYLVSNDEYLFLSGVSTRPPLNYQKQTLSIKTHYEVVEVPIDFYKDNNDVGFYRNETYPLSIQVVYNDGEVTDWFHIKGRDARKTELELVYGDDTFDSTVGCDKVKQNKRWEVYNTAGAEAPFKGALYCDKQVVAYGKLAYTESTELYPDNPGMFGKYACTPIKHHKLPDEAKSPRFRVDSKTGQVYLRLLTFGITDIPHPLNDNGDPVKDIAGFRIGIGDRTNNRTIIARGVFTNVREYTEKDKTIKYSNYPYNSLSKDLLLSDSPVYMKHGTEKGYKGLSTYKKDEFTFYGPHASFDRVGFGDYVTFETEEAATVKGFFEEVYKHPKAKLISDNVLYYAILIGAIDGYLRAIAGSKCEIAYNKGARTIETSTSTDQKTTSYANMTQVTRCNDILKSVGNIDAGASNAVSKGILKALGIVAKFGAFAFYAAETAQKVIDIVYNFSSWKQYAIQYNSHGEFLESKPIKVENKRRRIDNYQYLGSELNTIQGQNNTYYNNLYKENNVYVKLNKPVKPLTGDTTNTSISKAKKCGDFKTNTETKAKLYYGTIQRTLPNQYGQLDSIRYRSSGAPMIPTDSRPTVNTKYSIGMVFGGDCYINKFSINQPTDFFSHPLFKEPDGFVYNYRNYRTLGHPRYWIDTTQYEFLDMVPKASSGSSIDNVKESNLPEQKYNLDCKNKKGFSAVNNQYFYTSVNSVLEYIVESDYNLDLRDWKTPAPDFYTQNNNLSKLFENKGELRTFEEFHYDHSFSKKNDIEKFYQQALDFVPDVCSVYTENKMVYSQPSFKEQIFDNWLNFLSSNFFNFSQSQFGRLTTIKLIDNQQLIFLFDKSSPYITPGRAQLKTVDKENIYLGDGTLIREPRPLVLTDDNYGNCQSRFAFNHTKHGFFFPSQRKGNIFNYSQNLDEINRNGMYYFFQKYLPSQLLKQFPDFVDYDNPYAGVGLVSTYDASYETYYITKKDFSIKSEFIGLITYNPTKNEFIYKNNVISLYDTTYFEDASWTISYSPSLKAFISYHDYHPVAYINTENHFLSVLNKDGKGSIHIHNERCDSFSNFYGKDYPHAFILPINNGQEVEILKSIEYQAETFLYKNDCRDKFHVLDTTYDRAMIYNSEQITGWLNLIKKDNRNMSQLLKYDKDVYNALQPGFDIYYDKVEQKFRFNHFHDITKDRGEYSGATEELLKTDSSGYKFEINPSAVNYGKNIYQKKKIRHARSRLYLEKKVSGPNKHIFYFSNMKQTNSPR